jgi:hypothetical protein
LLRFFHKRHQEQMMAELILVAGGGVFICSLSDLPPPRLKTDLIASSLAVIPQRAKTQRTTHS